MTTGKKISYSFIVLVPALIIAVLTQVHLADITSLIVRAAGSYNLSDRGIRLQYDYISPGLRSEPFIFPFDHSIRKFSRGRIALDVVNTYTVGSYRKDRGARIASVSNFYDPTSRFKDSWFGVFIIFDDPPGRAKNYMLKDPAGDPAAIENLNPEALIELPRLDQMVVVHTTHQKQKGYRFNRFLRDFPFRQHGDNGPAVSTTRDAMDRTWLTINSAYETVSGLTDVSQTDMNLLTSIRAFVGLPSDRVYEHIDPWHAILIKGTMHARYFPCEHESFWAVVYYNGTAFTTKQGLHIDTWENSDIKQEFKKMFLNLEIGCLP